MLRTMWALLPLLVLAAGCLAAIPWPFTDAHHHHSHDHKHHEDQNKDQSQKDANTYDYVIVGAGSSGAVLASRLSEDPSVTVFLMEAGGQPSEESDIPLKQPEILKVKETEWGFYSERQKYACQGRPDNKILLKRYKALGGCSSHNSQIYTRGNPKDYDLWEKLGATGWGWKDVENYFKRSENFTINEYKGNGFHNTSGYLTIEGLRYKSGIYHSYMEAAPLMNYPIVDYNGPSQTGFSEIQATARDGRRCSVEKAFLRPAANRTNLIVSTYSYAKKVIMDGTIAVGVLYDKEDNKDQKVYARQEVILSAGAIKTPHLLMLSGIGPKRHLKKFGIKCIADLPVGKNFQDHIMAGGQVWTLNSSVTIMRKQDDTPEARDEFEKGQGVLTSPATFENMIFINTQYQDKSVDWPDAQIEACSSVCLSDLPQYDNVPAIEIIPAVCRPLGRGCIELNSTDPYDHPKIDPNYLSSEDDLNRLVDAMQWVRDMIMTPPFQKYDPKPALDAVNGCDSHSWNSTDYLRCHARAMTQTDFHYSGTCRMGDPNSNTTVVDPQLRVKYITGLRVVDASIMPTVPSANTNAPCIMIGEKAADIIRETKRIV